MYSAATDKIEPPTQEDNTRPYSYSKKTTPILMDNPHSHKREAVGASLAQATAN